MVEGLEAEEERIGQLMAAVDVETVVVVVVELVVSISTLRTSAGSPAGGAISAIFEVGVEMLARKSANVTPAGMFASKSANGMSAGFPCMSVMFVIVVLDIVI